MFGHTEAIHTLLCIFLVLPALVLTKSPPLAIDQHPVRKRTPTPPVQCYTRAIPANIAAELDCSSLIQRHVLDGPGPFQSSTAWKEAKDSNGNSVWSVYSKSCAIGLIAPPGTSSSEWNKYREGIKAIASSCVDPKELGGVMKGSVAGQPEASIAWITQTLKESRYKKTCLALLFSKPSTLSAWQQLKRKSCYQMIGATVSLFAAPVVTYTNQPLGILLWTGGGFLAHQARKNLLAGNREMANAFKRRRSMDGQRIEGLSERALVTRNRKLQARNRGQMIDGGQVMAVRRRAALQKGMMVGTVG